MPPLLCNLLRMVSAFESLHFHAGGVSDAHGFQMESLTKLLLLLKAVVEPEWEALKSVNWSHAKLFLPEPLASALSILRDHSLMLGRDGNRHPIFTPTSLIKHSWTPGLRYQFKRLFLLDTMPPAVTPAPSSTPASKPAASLKLALLRTRQGWRVHHENLYRLLLPRRGALLLHRTLVRAAAELVDGTATIDAPPRILFYSRDGGRFDHHVIKGEQKPRAPPLAQGALGTVALGTVHTLAPRS